MTKVVAPRGRPFAKGNPGRPQGSKNRITLLAAALLESETEELLRTAIAIANGGDGPTLKFLLGRLLPKERLVRLELRPADDDFDAVDAMRAILVAAASGQISPSEASALANIVLTYARTIANTEHSQRLESIEKDLGALKS